MTSSLDLVAQILVTASPFILAGLGGLTSEYAGRLNIGLEGMMLGGAFTAVAFAKLGAGMVAAIAAGAAAGIVCGIVLAAVNIRGGANIFIAGLAINLLVAGLVSFAGSWLFGTRSVIALGPESLSSRPIVELFFVLLSLLSCAALWLYTSSTRSGLRLRSVAQSSEMLTARGVDTDKIRMLSIVVSGLFAGLAGAQLSLVLGAFVPNQSAGKGWIALVLVFVGAKHPLGITISAIVFSLVGYWATEAQAHAEHPALLVAVPFIAVLAGLVLVQALRIFTTKVKLRRSIAGSSKHQIRP